MVATHSNTLGKQAVISLALCSASALGQVVGPAAHLEGAPSRWGVDIWQGVEYEPTTYVLYRSMLLSNLFSCVWAGF